VSDLHHKVFINSRFMIALKQGQVVNVGKLSDMRFGSQFSSTLPTTERVAVVQSVTAAPQVPLISNKPEHVERNVRYANVLFARTVTNSLAGTHTIQMIETEMLCSCQSCVLKRSECQMKRNKCLTSTVSHTTMRLFMLM